MLKRFSQTYCSASTLIQLQKRRYMTQVRNVDPAKILFENNKPVIDDIDTKETLKSACEILQHNDIIAFPTETVYGLAANCQSTDAVQKIYTAKNRPADNPLIIHVSSREMITETLGAEIPSVYEPLIKKFWPGPLTIIIPLPQKSTISPLCTKGQQTFGCRMPAHPVARALIEMSGLALAAPSANASTRPSCTEAKHVLEDLDGRIPLILDGGAANVGVESTVVDGLSSPPKILRPGGVSAEELRKFGGPEWENVISEVNVEVKDSDSVRAPGMKYKHYSPKARVVLLDEDFNSIELKSIGGSPKKIALLRSRLIEASSIERLWPNTKVIVFELGELKSQISHNLFSKFRDADNENVDLIVVEAVDTSDEGMAIMNRLNKAAETHVHAA